MGVATVLGRDAQGIARVVVVGVMTVQDLEAYLHTLARQGLFTTPTIIDSRAAIYSLSPAEAHYIKWLVVDLRRTYSYGFTAQVADVDVTFGILRMHALSTEDSDPGFAVFRTMEEAEQWMHEQIGAGVLHHPHAHP